MYGAFAGALCADDSSTKKGNVSLDAVSDSAPTSHDWPTFGNGPSHTGYSPFTIGTNIFHPGWSATFFPALNQVAVANGRVFITPNGRFDGLYLAALDVASGVPLWTHEFASGSSINPPTVDRGSVYVQRGNHASDTQLWCLDAATGGVRWNSPHHAQWERYYAPTVFGDGIWINGGSYGGMYGFNTNGAQRFFLHLPQYDEWTPTFYNGTVYAWVAGQFSAHDPVSGSERWSVDVGWNWHGWSMDTVAAIDQGRAFVVGSPNLYAIDLAQRTNVWSVLGTFEGSPAVAKGVVYAISNSIVNAYSADDGTHLGSFRTDGEAGLIGQPIVLDDSLLVSSASATYLFNLDTLQLRQTIPFGGPLSVANRILYIAGLDGVLSTYYLKPRSTADLAVSVSDSPDPVKLGNTLTYSVLVSNCAPTTATGVIVTDKLPPNSAFISASSSRGSCSQSGGVITCNLGSLAQNSNVWITISVEPTEGGTITNSATVRSGLYDPNSSNTAAATVTTVHGPGVLAVSLPNSTTSYGPVGTGPFTPTSATWTLSNTGTGPLDWAATHTANWLSLSSTNGTLGVGASTSVTISINANARMLAVGSYSDSITFVNLSNGNGTATRVRNLHVQTPSALSVQPGGGLTSGGFHGGPFNPSNQVYTLANTGGSTLRWTAAVSQSWLRVAPTNGLLAPGASTTVVVSIQPSANALAPGAYDDTVVFRNTTNNNGNTNRPVHLAVNPIGVLEVSPSTHFNSAGIVGGPFTPSRKSYLLTNVGTATLAWTTAKNANWVTVTPAAGTLPPDASATVTLQLNANANSLGVGYYTDVVAFSNATYGVGSTTRRAGVAVYPVFDHFSFSIIQSPRTSAVPFTVTIAARDATNGIVTAYKGTVTLSATNDSGAVAITPTRSAAFSNGQWTGTVTLNAHSASNVVLVANDRLGHSGQSNPFDSVFAGFLKGGAWPTFGNGPSHTGRYNGSLGTNTFAPGWTVAVSNATSGLNQVAVANGRVFVTPIVYFTDTFLTALNAATGAQLWRHPFDTAFSINPPTYHNGSVYVQRGHHGSDTQLWCLDATTGNVRWSAPHYAQWERYLAPTVFGDGIWVNGGYYGGMYGFSTNGSQRFFSELPQFDQWTPTYYNNTVYSWVGGRFTAHNPTTGNTLWSVNVGSGSSGVSAIEGGRAFVIANPNLHAIDLAAKTNLWTVLGSFRGSPAVANDVVYVISNAVVSAYNAQNGTYVRSYSANHDAGLTDQPIILNDGLLIASQSATYVFDLSTAHLLQTIPHGGHLSVAEGRLFIAGPDGVLRSYHPAGPVASSRP